MGWNLSSGGYKIKSGDGWVIRKKACILLGWGRLCGSQLEMKELDLGNNPFVWVVWMRLSVSSLRATLNS